MIGVESSPNGRAALVPVLTVIVFLLLSLGVWIGRASAPREAAGPSQVVVRVVDGSTVLSTQVVPLR